MTCPHCGRTIRFGVMCADCADAISTNELFYMLTFNGKISDNVLVVLVSLISMAGASLMGAALVMFAL